MKQGNPTKVTKLQRTIAGLLIIIASMACFLPGYSQAVTSVNGWIYQETYPTENNLYGVKFVTVKKGWVVGDYGTILHTEDGGETWDVQESGTEHALKSIFFVNDKQGWVVGKGGVILHTEDGGKTWINQGNGNLILNQVFFLNGMEGWAVGNSGPGLDKPKGIILHTVDGGRNWKTSDIEEKSNIAEIYFIDIKTGWLLAGTTVFRTTNGGKSWDSSELLAGNSRGYGDVHFVDNSTGWAVVGKRNIYHTADGGGNMVRTFRFEIGGDR